MTLMKPMNWIEEKKLEASLDDDFIRLFVFSETVGIAALVDRMIERGYPTSVLCPEIADRWLLRFGTPHRMHIFNQMRKRIQKIYSVTRTLVESEMFRLNHMHLIIQDR